MTKKLLSRDHLLDAQVVVGMYKSSFGQIPLHSHDFYEFLFVVEGELLHVVHGKAQVLHAGDVVFIRPHDEHSIKGNPGEQYTYFNCALSLHTLFSIGSLFDAEVELRTLLESNTPLVVSISADLSSTYEQRLRELYTYYLEQHRFFKRMCIQFLCDLFIECISHIHQKETFRLPQWLIDVTQLMHEPKHVEEPLSFFVERSQVTYQHLWRSFTHYFHTTPLEYLHTIKIQSAIRALIFSDHSIAHISFECGFSSPSHFYKLFKKHKNMTPHQYRILHRSQEYVSPNN